MTLNEILVKQNILTPILLTEGDNELSKELKVKIVRLRIAYNKIKKQFDDEVQEFTTNLMPEELKSLQAIPENERTEEDTQKILQLVDKVNSEYREFLTQKGKEEVQLSSNDAFTEKEFDEIVMVNAGNEVTINGNVVKAEDLMESFYSVFVNKD